jgi:hypothetical protein
MARSSLGAFDGCNRATLGGHAQPDQGRCRRSIVTGAGCTDGGVHPAMMRAHSRTRVLSVMACAAEWNRKVA